MLNSFLEIGEQVYFSTGEKGKRYDKKDTYLYVIGLLFGLVSVACLVLWYIYNTDLMFPFIISTLICFGLLFYFFKLNKNYVFNNEKINFQCMITNKKFVYIEANNKNFLQIPINYFYEFHVYSHEEVNKNTHDFALRTKHIPQNIRIDNNKIKICDGEIVLNNVMNPYLLLCRLEFLFYLDKLGLKDIKDENKFLEPDEKILYTKEWNNVYMSQILDSKSKSFFKIGIIILVIYIAITYIFNLFDDFIIIHSFVQLFLLFFLMFVLGKFESIIDYVKSIFRSTFRRVTTTNTPKTYNYRIKYVITNKRVLFFDYNITLLYAFELSELDYINIDNYDASNDVGDIYLCNTFYSKYLECLRYSYSSTDRRRNLYLNLFPNNYFNTMLDKKIDNMNCCKIKLYKVSNPASVINNFLIQHQKNKNTK